MKVVLLLGVFASQIWANALKPLTNQQVIEDLHELQHTIRDYYGPLQMKERNHQFELDKLVAEMETKIRDAKSENEALSYLTYILGRLNDGHVAIQFPEYSNSSGETKLPISLAPIEGKAIVVHVEDSAKIAGIEVGDEVVSIDKTPVMEFATKAAKYMSLGNPRSNAHLVRYATRRPAHFFDFVPKEAEAVVEIKKSDGKTYVNRVIWRAVKPDEKRVEIPGFSMESNVPFFISTKNKAQFRVTIVRPNEEYLAKYKVDISKLPDIFAAIYKYQGKTIVMIRQPTYKVADADQRIQYYKAVMDQFEPFADVLVIDQTHNPGGDSLYLERFFRLFLKDKSPNIVQFVRADRKWVRRLEQIARHVDPSLESEAARQWLLRAKIVEDANERGDFSIPLPVPMNQESEVQPDPEYTWKKPLLVLTDELAGSCGDLFPLMMKRAGWKTFGLSTMGLGGSVETFGQLTHSGGEVTLARGLLALYRPDGSYQPTDYVENTGVKPDIEYEPTVKDFREGFIQYLEEMSKAALAQIPPG